MSHIAIAAAVLASALALGEGCSIGKANAPHAQAETAHEAHARALAASATAFLDSLSDWQRGNVLFPLEVETPATTERFAGGMDGRLRFVGEKYGQAMWSNFPVSDVPRPGLTLGSLDGRQRAAAMQLLQTLLSRKGYEKVIEIMDSDQVLSERGTPFASGRAYYTIGIFGHPSESLPWMVQFGGHHLALNITIVQGRGVITPTLTGAQPASFTSHGKTIQPLGAENDKAFALLDALDADQRKQAILNYKVPDLVAGPGHDGRSIQPEGLKASQMNDSQRAMLVDVISQWAGIINDTDAAARMTEIKAGLDDTYFAWSGPTTHEPGKNGSAYYRIQGPKLIIEFAPQGVGGDPTMHVHTVYRDPTNDYGRELVNQ